MTYGPIELLVIEFPGNQFSGEIIPALSELVESGQIRVIDMLVAIKDGNGDVTVVEVSDLGDEINQALDALVDDWTGMLTTEDAILLSETLAPNSTVGLLMFENVWASRFATAVRNANGQVLLNERIPGAVIDELVALQAAADDE